MYPLRKTKTDNVIKVYKYLKDNSSVNCKRTKKDILDYLSDCYGEAIEEKQFYRIIEKIAEIDDGLVKCRGARASYYMDQHSWHISEKLYLKHLIAYDKNLSKKDKFKLLTKINKMMYETETTKKDDFLLEKINNIKNNQISFLDNLNLIFEAYSKNLKICFKLYINDEISDEIIGVIEEIIFSNHIMVIVNETAYFLKDMINIHYL